MDDSCIYRVFLCPANHVKLSSSHMRLMLLFLTFSVLVANPKKLLYTMANPSWSAEQGKENKRKSLAAYPSHPPHCSFGEKYKQKKNHATHLQALRRSWSVSRPYKNSFGSSTRSKGVASQNSPLQEFLRLVD